MHKTKVVLFKPDGTVERLFTNPENLEELKLNPLALVNPTIPQGILVENWRLQNGAIHAVDKDGNPLVLSKPTVTLDIPPLAEPKEEAPRPKIAQPVTHVCHPLPKDLIFRADLVGVSSMLTGDLITHKKQTKQSIHDVKHVLALLALILGLLHVVEAALILHLGGYL